MPILLVKWLFATVSGAHVLQLLFLLFLMIKRVYAMLEAMRRYTYLRGVSVSEEHFSQYFLVPSALPVLFLLIHGCCISLNRTFHRPFSEISAHMYFCTHLWNILRSKGSQLISKQSTVGFNIRSTFVFYLMGFQSSHRRLLWTF